MSKPPVTIPKYTPGGTVTTTTTAPKAKPKNKKPKPSTTSTTTPAATPTTTSTTEPSVTPTLGRFTYPDITWFENNIKSLTADEKAKLANFAGRLVIPVGKNNPSNLDYMTTIFNDLTTSGGAPFTDKVMDAMFGGIQNYNWRDMKADPHPPKGQVNKFKVFKDRNDQVWRDILGVGVSNIDRKSYKFSPDGGATTTQQIVDNLLMATNANAAATVKSNAANALNSQLDAWGLGSLQEHFDDLIWKKGISAADAMKAVRLTKAYKTRFAGMLAHNSLPNVPVPLTEATFLSTEQQMLNTANQYLPSGFITEKMVGDLIGKGVGAKEFDQRVMKGYAAAQSADPTTKKYLNLQGVDDKGIAAYYLDTTRGEEFLTKQVAAATLRGYSDNIGLTGFNQQMADELAGEVRRAADNPYGTFTMDQARKAMDYAASGVTLTGATAGSNAPTVDTTQLIGSKIAGFQGTVQEDAQRAVSMAQQAQAAPFNKGGQYEANTKGVTGVGSAPQ